MSNDRRDANRADAPENHTKVDDARFARAWRVWLAALAHDSEAAYAAALTYRSLDVAGREAWIEALEVDGPNVGAPAIALYAPLLGVEEDPARRARLSSALTRQTGAPVPTTQTATAGLRGQSHDRRVIVVVQPLYLDFVEVLFCSIDNETGCFREVDCDPLRRDQDAPRAGQILYGVELEDVPIEMLVEELSHAVLAHRRHGLPLHAALRHFVDIFSPRPEVVDTAQLRKRPL